MNARTDGPYHHGNLRQAMVEAALAEVDRGGADKVSIAALARALGVSQPAPYRHFANRDALLAAVASHGFQLFMAALAASQEGGRPDGGCCREMSKAYIAFGTARPGLYELMFTSPLLAQAAEGDELKAVARRSFEMLIDVVPASGDGRSAERVALRIWVALHGTVMLVNRGLLHREFVPVEIDELLDDIVGPAA